MIKKRSVSLILVSGLLGACGITADDAQDDQAPESEISSSLSVAPNQVIVWMPSPDRLKIAAIFSAPITGCQIFRSTAPGQETLRGAVSGASCLFDDTAVTANTTYYYQVAGVDAAGLGPRSTEKSRLYGLHTPNPVYLLWGSSPESSTVDVKFLGDFVSTPPAVTYSIYRSTSSGAEVKIADAVPYYTNQGEYFDHAVAPNTTYFYRVSQNWGSLSSPLSPEQSIRPLSAPVLTVSELDDMDALLTWTPTPGASPSAFYTILRGTQPDAGWVVIADGLPPSQTTYIDSQALFGEQYYIVELNDFTGDASSDMVYYQPF